ncbi:uncharacterized protein LOC110812041 [Carica papaya]|uniref:uncharacterized protein LOC110812041 n=1 Tax=Carica papaya TaxID=3649 RepID=UPI000B8C7BC0|nr:uncharacterized protein LOC110812041 [Carica papaya]
MEPCRREEKQATIDNLPLGLDMKEVPANGYLVENLWNHPNQLSEEMVCCMRDIFLFLADPSKTSSEHIASPCSPQGHLSYSSLTSFLDSPALTSLGRSPSLETDHDSEIIIRDTLSDPYKVPGKLEWTKSIGPYSAAVEVAWFSVGKKELEYAAIALKRFRMLVEQLASVNPSCMSCNEKLAFWINLYNALIMHGYLAYGVPKSDMKLFSLMQKAAYTIGGQSLSAAYIEYIILKMKPPAHRPQIAVILALQKFKISEEQKQYSIDHPEPLLSFALSCGMHSSPAVRIFRPENVSDLLKSSLQDYVQASVGISDKGKLLVPKLLYCFAKGVVDESMVPAWISQYLSPEQAAIVRTCSAAHKWKLLGARSFSVLPFDTRFRFLFLREGKSPSSPA